jgi:predicted methyltransferase
MLVIRLRDMFRSPTKMLIEAGVRPGMAVLDFGCGPGGFAMAAARLVGQHGSVHAVDVRTPALERVRRIARRRKLANIQVMHGGDMARLPDESIDMALLYDVLHIDLAPASAERILLSIHRLLRPQGMLSVTDHHMTAEQITGVLTSQGLFMLAGSTRRTVRFEKARADGVKA